MDKKAKLEALKYLRQRTKAGVMACNEALKEAKGDLNKAIDLLYVEAQKKVIKLSQKETPQRFIFGGVNAQKRQGVLIQLSCQTDFVGNNEDFKRLAKEMVKIALEVHPLKGEDLLQAKIDKKSLQELINFWIAAFGENIVLSDYALLEGEQITCFIHPNKKSGSLLESNATAAYHALERTAMQVTLKKPMAISPQEVIDTLQEGGKQIPHLEKLAASKALLTQPFFENEAQSVADYLKQADPKLLIKRFVRAPQKK